MADVGVLLPVRLETRFVPPEGDAGWLLLVRIVPDAPFFARHEPVPTAAELDAVEVLWAGCGGDLTTDAGRESWSRLVAVAGAAARAAWLYRTFPASLVDGRWLVDRPAELRTDLTFSRLVGLPDELELWLARGGADPSHRVTLVVDHGRLALDPPDPAAGEARWYSSFKAAVDVGLGAVVDVGLTRPDDIDVVYVVGLGGADPVDVFADHRDAGILGVLSQGVPTNTVHGEPAADIARDPETWRVLASAPPSQPGADAVGLALTGSAGALGPLPGGEVADRDLSRLLVGSLFPVLWGRALRDLWGVDEALVDDLTLWAFDHLAPEGPVPPIRIGDQPYGILPATSLARWAPAPGDPPVEGAVLPLLHDGRAAAATAAEAAGTTVGASTERLLDLLGRVPRSRGWAWRWTLPVELVQLLTALFGPGIVPLANLEGWWDSVAKSALRITGGPPLRRFVPWGAPQDLDLPLVVPDNGDRSLDDLLTVLVETIRPQDQFLADIGMIRELFHPFPNSLLFRLLLHARLLDTVALVRHANGDTGALLEPVAAPDGQPTVLSAWASQWVDGMLDGSLASRLFELGWDATAHLHGLDPVALERAFRSVLDTASHRIDPWVTGIAGRRLWTLAGTGARFRVGAYGWVDSPRPRSVAATADEYLHAPAEAQALTAAVLRDRARHDAEPGRWDLDLDSDGVRLADQLAAEVRLGAPLVEVVGRAVERVVHDRAQVDGLRTAFPVRTEHAGRRVCDGLAVLARFAAAPATLGLTAEQSAGVAALAAAIDAYGDLLVADAVFDVVSGRAHLAGASMEAAAGLAAPPALDVLATQRGGRTATTTVVVALPAGEAPAAVTASTSPGRLAEPAVADLLVARTGGPADAAWTWHVVDADSVPVAVVTLADLGLEPVDALSLSEADVAALILDGRDSTHRAVAAVPSAVDAARRLSDVLGNQPATTAHLGAGSASADVHAELLARYGAVHALGLELQAALVAAAAGPDAGHHPALRDAARWGITPMRADQAGTATLVLRAADALAGRLAAAPTPADAVGLDFAPLARALAELVSPEGRLPVLARHRLDTVPAGLVADPAAAAPADRLDPGWLELVAPVRAPLARLEAHQLTCRVEGRPPLSAWTTRPGDPWQIDAGPPDESGLVAATTMLAAFAHAGALEPGADPARWVAVGLLDQWTEVVPAVDHTTTVAFHHDAPGARAPQAVLVAVPPDVDADLDGETLVAIVGETRTTARARAAVPPDLDAYSAALPLLTLPADGTTAVRLERTP